MKTTTHRSADVANGILVILDGLRLLVLEQLLYVLPARFLQVFHDQLQDQFWHWCSSCYVLRVNLLRKNSSNTVLPLSNTFSVPKLRKNSINTTLLLRNTLLVAKQKKSQKVHIFWQINSRDEGLE